MTCLACCNAALRSSRQLGRNVEGFFGFLILGLLRSSYQFLDFEL